MRLLYDAASKGLFEPWIKKKEELRARKSFCLYGQLWQDHFWNIKFVSGIYIRKRVLKLGEVIKRSHKNNLRL